MLHGPAGVARLCRRERDSGPVGHRPYADREPWGAGEAAAAQIKQQALADWTGHLEMVHAALSPYVLGAQLCAADLYLHMLAGWYPSDDPALASRLPKLKQHAELMRQRPATMPIP